MAESYNIQQQVQLRSLCCNDVPAIKLLCNQCFPIQYPAKWYEEIVRSDNFHSIAATIDHTIVAFIVCQVKPISACNVEDQGILGGAGGGKGGGEVGKEGGGDGGVQETQVAYILSLGVLKTYRRCGIASMLLDYLLQHLRSQVSAVKAVFLHVLTTNTVAIDFYEHCGFHQHANLPFYYCIEGQLLDAFCYVLYINGGGPPFSFLECCRQVASSLATVCSVSASLLSKLKGLSRRLLSHVFTATLRLS